MNQPVEVKRLRYGDLFITRDGSVPNKDARLTNCLVEAVNGDPQIVGRTGFATYTSVATGVGHGMTVWTKNSDQTQKVYCVVGTQVYRATGTATTVISTYGQGAANEIVDWNQYYDGSYVVLKNSLSMYGMNTSTDAVTKVTSGNYPATTVRGIAYLDGTFYVMDPNGTIFGSNSEDIFTWSALNFISANAEPDGGVALARAGSFVVAFGNYTTQFFYDAGNATGSPLSRAPNGTILSGCASSNSIAYCDGSFYYISQSKGQGPTTNAGVRVSVLKGISSQVISTDSIERLLKADGLVNAYGNAINVLGHDLYIISLPTSGLSLVYDITSQWWYVFTTCTATANKSVSALTSVTNVDGTTVTATATSTTHGFADGDPITVSGANQSGYNITTNIRYVDANTFTYQVPSIPVTPATGTIVAVGISSSYYPMLQSAQYGTIQIAQHIGNGGIYQISDTVYTDATITIDSHIRTGRIDGDANQQKFLPWIDVITDRISANALVRWTDDDYQTYTSYRKVSLSGKRSRLTRNGSFKRRAFEIRRTDAAALRFQGLDLPIEKGIE